MGPLGIASAVLGIFGSLFGGGGGPNPDQIILDGVNDLKKQLDGLRKAMEKDFTSLSKLSIDIMNAVDRAITLVGQGIQINEVNFEKIEAQLALLTTEFITAAVDQTENIFSAIKLKRLELSADTSSDLQFSSKLTSLTTEIVQLGAFTADDTALTGNNPNVGQRIPLLTSVETISNQLSFNVGYLADLVEKYDQVSIRPVNPDYWSRTAANYSLILSTLAIPAFVQPTLKPDVDQLKEKGAGVQKLLKN